MPRRNRPHIDDTTPAKSVAASTWLASHSASRRKRPARTAAGRQSRSPMPPPVRRDGRDPMSLGDMLGALVPSEPGRSRPPAPRCASDGRPAPRSRRPRTSRRRLRRRREPAHCVPGVGDLGDEDASQGLWQRKVRRRSLTQASRLGCMGCGVTVLMGAAWRPDLRRVVGVGVGYGFGIRSSWEGATGWIRLGAWVSMPSCRSRRSRST